MTLVSLAMSAQGWTKTDYKGDELKGIAPYTAHSYYLPNNGQFVVWDWGDPNFRLVTDKGMFREDSYNTGFGYFRADKVYVGIYRMSTKELIEKYEIYMNIEDNSMYKRIYINTNNATRGGIKKVRKILKALQTEDIYVRFVCKRNNMEDFDLCVPCYQEDKVRILQP